MSTIDKETLKIFDRLDKLNPEAKFLSESALSSVTEWHDTGCMVLNAILSGSLYGGVPKGRIVGFAGPSQAGKTYITNKILAKAQQQGLIPVIFDTEMAVMRLLVLVWVSILRKLNTYQCKQLRIVEINLWLF